MKIYDHCIANKKGRKQMDKDMSYEIFPNVKVTEAKNISYNKGKRLDTSKFKQLDRTWHTNGWSDQEVRDKIGKNNGWAVCKSWTDAANKKMCYEVMINAKQSEVRTVGFDEVCKDLGWKSFKISKDGQMIFPVK